MALLQIETINLTNFKCFSSLEETFKPGVNLLVGANGSGKSALLEGIVSALGCFFIDLEPENKRGIKKEYLRVTPFGETDNCKVVATGQLNGIVKRWERNLPASTKNNDSRNANDIRDFATERYENINDPNSDKLVPLIAYYSTQRLFKDSNSKTFDSSKGRKNGHYLCLGDQSIRDYLTNWFDVKDRARFNHLRAEAQTPSDNFHLETVERFLAELLSYFFEVEVERIKLVFDPEDKELDLQIGDGEMLPLASYSDGMRNLIWLYFDLVWRAVYLKPPVGDWTLGSTEGVVLIDEIDLHLHPKWQSKAIPFLQKIFPKVQFFITTHSPIVVANFRSGHLFQVSKDTVEPLPPPYYGKKINSVIRDIFGGTERAPEVQSALNHLFSLIEGMGSADSINHNHDEIEAQMVVVVGFLGEGDPDVSDAKSLIAWYKSPEYRDAIH